MPPRLVSVLEAADALGLPVSGVEALVDAGYLRQDADHRVSLSEIKAFQARNANDAGDTAVDLLGEIGAADEQAEALLDALERSVGDMAARAADIAAAAFPEAAAWTDPERHRYSARPARRRYRPASSPDADPRARPARVRSLRDPSPLRCRAPRIRSFSRNGYWMLRTEPRPRRLLSRR